MIAKTLPSFVALLTLAYGSPTPFAKAARTAIDGAFLNAAEGGLYIGKPTSTLCPDESAPCDTFTNIPSITVSNSNGTAHMNVYIPGGQVAYVDDVGNFAYAAAHAQTLPSPTTQRGFTRVERFEPTETYAIVTYKGQSWKACPVDESSPNGTIYQVSTSSGASSSTGCIDFEMAAIEIGNVEPQAYEYAV